MKLDAPRSVRGCLALAVLTAATVLSSCSDQSSGPAAGAASVAVTPESATLLVQTTRQLTATVRDANGTELTGRPLAWKSGNVAVATVDASGLVTALSAGSAAVIATSEGVSDTAAITVGTLSVGSVTAGGSHTCGLTAAGTYCWGSGGRLGDGSTTPSSVPVAVTGGLTFYAVTAGAYSTCGVTTSGAPYCWGFRWGSPDSVPVAVPGGHQFSAVTVGGGFGPDHACGLTTSGAAYCWGNNTYGELGDGTASSAEVYNGWYISSVPVAVEGGLTFSALSASNAINTCGLTTSGAAYCWGDNEYGQLGGGSTGSRSLVPVAVAGGLMFGRLSTGGYHGCGVTLGGLVYCWGSNSRGQLGDGTTTNTSVPVKVAEQP